MKVIFLDIDGVLIPTGTRRMFPSSRCVEQLNRVTNATDARIVLSSSLRFDPDIADVLADWGVQSPIIGRTPRVDHGQASRGQEIATWLAEYDQPIEKFVILDDNRDMGPTLAAHLVLCDCAEGLTEADAREAIRKFE